MLIYANYFTDPFPRFFLNYLPLGLGFFFVEIVSLLLFSGFCFFLPPFSFVCWIELVGLRMFGCGIGHRWRFDAAVGWVEEGGRPLRPVRPAAA